MEGPKNFLREIRIPYMQQPYACARPCCCCPVLIETAERESLKERAEMHDPAAEAEQ